MKKCILILIVSLSSLCCLFAAGGYYEKGDTLFTFDAGIVCPVFLKFTNNDDFDFLAGADDMHSTIGGVAGISYQSYISRYWALGAELDYAFVNSKSGLNFAQIPISAKLTYTPVQTGKFDLNLNANLGIAFLKYNGNTTLSPVFAQISINPVYYFGSSWGLGLECGIWADAELYFTEPKKADNCIASFAPVTLTLCYRH